MRIDLALLFSWRQVAKIKNSMNTNLLILDEVFDSSLDSNGTTTGGMAGDIIRLICVEDGSWYVDAKLTTSGTLAKAGGTALSGSVFATEAG